MAIELHLHEPEFNFAPNVGRSKSDGRTEDDEATEIDGEDGGGSGRGKLGAVLALVLLVGLALAVRKFRADGPEDELTVEN